MSEPIMLKITPYRALFGQRYRSVMRCGKHAVEGPLLKVPRLELADWRRMMRALEDKLAAS